LVPHRRTILVAVVSLALAALAALSASAMARLTYDSTIKVYESFPTFHGKVNSEDGSFCIDNRRVKMFKQRNGADQLLGKDRTNPHGRWRINYDAGSGAYYAKVKELSSASLGVTCRRDKSNVVVID
jgi:hypothetical protein